MSDKGWVNGGEHPTLPFSNRDTSKDAAKSIIGSATSLRRVVYDVIKCLGGCTDEEIEVETGLTGSTVRPRRRELVLSGAIVDSGERRKTRSGRTAAVHVVVED